MSKRDVMEIAGPTQSSYGDFALGMSMKLRGLAAVARGMVSFLSDQLATLVHDKGVNEIR
jgi:hypothetical protein